ncbi:MAG TPA: hypothetical protein VHM19_05330, partial [Polyangiales bacterium]|nr:hypothetical protein [Polyangiales bacterium]
TEDGRLKLYAKLGATPAGRTQHVASDSPWNNALAHGNALLDARYGRMRRAKIQHAPVLFERASYGRCLDVFADAVQRTRHSRFRGEGNVAPEHLYPHWMWHEGLAERVPLTAAYRDTGYASLESSLAITGAQLALLALRRPKLYCLNDSFDAYAEPRVVRLVRAFLEHMLPEPSRFERARSGELGHEQVPDWRGQEQ